MLTGLTLLFVALKLIGEIDWHWFWVISPFLLELVGVLLFFCALVMARLKN